MSADTIDLSLDHSDMLRWLTDYPNQLQALYPAGLAAGRSLSAGWASGQSARRSAARGAADFPPVTDVLVLGTGGGSAAAAYVAASILKPRLRVPFTIVQNYDLPEHVLNSSASAGALILAISHSGQTEETLNAFSQLPEEARHRAAVITGGRKLGELAADGSVPVVTLPTGMQARAVFPGILAAILGVVDGAGLTVGDFAPEISEAAGLAAQLAKEWGPAARRPGNPEGYEPGRTNFTPLALASHVAERLVLIYGGPGATEGIARRWKNQLAENGKTLSHWYTIPEAHHDEVVGYEAPRAIRELAFGLLLRDPAAESARMRKRLDTTFDLLHESMAGVGQVATRGSSDLARAVSLCLFGDYLSCYVALLRGIDPTPVPIIVSLKERMARD